MVQCKGLNNWVRKLSRQDMPVVGEVIGELSELTGSDDADANQLADVILRDPNLTSHVLRIANSVHYNYSSYPINTVSRAIVLIGFKGMRAICISSLVIDSFLKRGPRERLLELMAGAFHAATQARNLMHLRRDDRAEEAFIAALLFHLGEMAFWASDSNLRDDAELTGENDNRAMEEAIGTSFKAISLELARQWRLGETLERALHTSRDGDTAVSAVLLCEELSRCAAREGWDSPATRDVIQRIARFTSQTNEDTHAMVRETAEQTAEIARTYGADAVCRLLPTASAEAEAQERPEEPELHLGDPQVQLNILRELSMAASDIGDVNAIMRMVVEGMHRGIGLPRVAVAFVKQERLHLKYTLGDATDHWRDRFNFDVSSEAEHLFNAALQDADAHWVTQEEIGKHPEWHSPVMVDVIGRHEAFVANIRLGGRRVGLFYADARGRYRLTQEQFDSFRHFQTQALMNLMLLSQKRSH